MRRALALCLALGLCLARATTAEARPTDVSAGELWHYAAGDAVESYDTPHFRIFFTRSGTNAVPATGVNAAGVPNHVVEVGQLYEDVLAFYLGRGFLSPLSDTALANNGGDGRFDVYLLDFAGKADGTFSRDSCDGSRCVGYMVQENDFVGYAYPSATIGNRILASHEFFHAVQAVYNADLDSVIAEGTAVWATEQFDSSLNDFEGFVGAYLAEPDRSLDKPGTGPVPAFAYGSALFFQFLSEKLDVAVIRKLYEDCVPGARGVAAPIWLPALDALLVREYATSFAALFTEFATWNLFTMQRSDPQRSYQRGAGYPVVTASIASLPYEEATLRVFHAATQLMRFEPTGRSALVVEVLPAVGLGGESLAALRVVVATVVGGKIGNVTTRLAGDPAVPVDLAGATQVFVGLVNGAVGGDSTRGILCIGDATEAAACKAKYAPATGAMPPAAEGGGCALAPSRAPGGFPSLLLVVAGIAMAMARRRRERTAR